MTYAFSCQTVAIFVSSQGAAWKWKGFFFRVGNFFFFNLWTWSQPWCLLDLFEGWTKWSAFGLCVPWMFWICPWQGLPVRIISLELSIAAFVHLRLTTVMFWQKYVKKHWHHAVVEVWNANGHNSKQQQNGNWAEAVHTNITWKTALFKRQPTALQLMPVFFCVLTEECSGQHDVTYYQWFCKMDELV